jgi:hypothetical protein
LIWIKANCPKLRYKILMWQLIGSAPFDRDLELAVIDRDGEHALAFPCRRVANGWIGTADRQMVDVRPTHWREWDANAERP